MKIKSSIETELHKRGIKFTGMKMAFNLYLSQWEELRLGNLSECYISQKSLTWEDVFILCGWCSDVGYIVNLIRENSV